MFGGDENVLELDMMIVEHCKCAKTTELYTVKAVKIVNILICELHIKTYKHLKFILHYTIPHSFILKHFILK